MYDLIDFHCHSYFSDGLLSPAELAQRAIASGLSKLALTDHDTICGLEDLNFALKNNPRSTNLKIIAGIELSASWKKYDIHIVGLNFNIKNQELINLIELQTNNRIKRAIKIGELFQKIGIADAYPKACEIAGHNRVGRPHFAKVLLNEKLVPNYKFAFQKFLGKGKCCYVASNWINLEKIIEVIVAAKGIAVLAHPLKYLLTNFKLLELISDFKRAGGQGIEVVSGETSGEEIKALANLALKFELYASSGSDYHGDEISRVSLGMQKMLPENCKPLAEIL